MAEVDSSFHLVVNCFRFRFYFAIPKEEVFAVALSLEVSESLFQVVQTHASHYCFGVYLYLFQLQFRFFLPLVPLGLLEHLNDY